MAATPRGVSFVALHHFPSVTNSTTIDGRSRRLLPTPAAYGVLVGVPALIIVALLRIGERLPTAAGNLATPRAAAGAPAFDPGPLTLQMVVSVAVARVAGSVLARLGQPRVVGEMAAG